MPARTRVTTTDLLSQVGCQYREGRVRAPSPHKKVQLCYVGGHR
ncbi:unnamed protein product [Ectocarpus sp. CCAP 1310/34]|nr:unnamed protein product [Ectocarpus sp. CCAP 1310/34]